MKALSTMILIKAGRVIDPANKRDQVCDILLEGGKIARIEKDIHIKDADIIDATGKIVLPGLVDMHVHLRQPGREDKETVASGTLAAAKGGVTSILAMPNTNPAMDSPDNIKLLQGMIREDAKVQVLVAGAITKARAGQELVDVAKLKKQGAATITDDGYSVDAEKIMLEAFKAAKRERLLVICHSEDKTLSNHGSVNLGVISTRLGLKGISAASEFKRVERDISLAAKANCPVHIAHVSCKESVEIIAKAKKKGIKVTAETAPHYFSLSDEAVLGFDTNMKMNPPLRSKGDVAAIKQGLSDGTIDVIASDHAPHTENEKEIEFERAEFGVIGLETELAASISALIQPGILDWKQLVEKLSVNPARILGIKKGGLGAGADADLVVVAADQEWLVEKKNFVSKSKNSCFIGRRLQGVVSYTICAGKIVYQM